MLVTLAGIVIPVRLVQPEKAKFPMLVTLAGIVSSVTNYPMRYRSWAYLRGLEENAIPHHAPMSEIYMPFRLEQP